VILRFGAGGGAMNSFKVTNCDLERSASSRVSWNMKSDGNRAAQLHDSRFDGLFHWGG
jgi:hypothetical protein